MDTSARGASRFPLPPGCSNSEIWDLASVQAEVTTLSQCPLLDPGPGDLKDRVQVVLRSKGFWLGELYSSARTDWVFMYKCQPQPQHSQLHQEEELERLPFSPCLRLPGKLRGLQTAGRGGPEGLGQLHPLRLAQLHRAA